jgi:hypothetical protein
MVLLWPLNCTRWLIDTDKDALGMNVIVDLHGGDASNPAAQTEFKEIKEKVMEEVSTVGNT